MSGFDFLFALFTLVLGLAITEVLSGFASAMKIHARARIGRALDIRIGWLTPLLAVLVVLNQLMFWDTAYQLRETLPYSYLSLLCVLIVVGSYYLFSVLVFPDHPEEWPDFDIYYDQHNRLILGGLFVINAVSTFVTSFWMPVPSKEMDNIVQSPLGIVLFVGVLATLVMMLALIFVRGRRANLILLSALILVSLGGAVMGAIYGF